MITEEEKRIYNNHLVASRKSQNQPFQIRKNFDKFDEDKVVFLQKLSKFFNSYPHIKQEDYFIAPFIIWPDTNRFDLDFYLTGKARKAYTQYIKAREFEDPDTLTSLERLKDSLKFVYKFCSEHNLTLEEYPLYVEEKIPSMLSHLKDHKINFYALHALGVSKLNIDTRILDFMFDGFYTTLQKTKNKFFASRKMKSFSKQIITKITEKLKND